MTPSTPSKQLKVGIVCDDSLDFPDGVQQYMLTVGNWLSQQGHSVYYIVAHTTTRSDSNIIGLSKYLGLTFNKNRVRIPLPITNKKAKDVLAALQLDVLHVQMPYSPMLAEKIIMNADKNTAIVGTFHIMPAGQLQAIGTKALRLMVRKSLKRFDQVMSVSEPARIFAEKSLQLSSAVVPNAVTLPIIKSTEDNKNQITFLGRLVERKGCMVLLQAIAHMKNEGTLPDGWKVHIAGRGKLEPQLRAYAKKHSLDAFVEFHGYVSEEEKYRLLTHSAIAVFPSSGGESFGIVLTEAIASGALVLAGNNPGYASVLGEHSTALFAPKNATALASKLSDFIRSDAKTFAEKELQAKRLKLFLIDVVGPQILEVYQKAIANKV